MKAKGNVTEVSKGRNFIGLGWFKVIGVNPTNAEKAKFYGKDETISGNEPEYTKQLEDGTYQTRLEIWVKSDKVAHVNSKNEPINFISKVTIYLEDRETVKRDGTGKQIVDCFGNAKYTDNETIEKHGLPYYISKDDGVTKIPYVFDTDYHVARVGEAAVLNFLVCQVGVKSVLEQKNGKWVITQDEVKRNDSNVFLETPWGEICKGNIKEIKEAIMLHPENVLKILCGIKTTEDGSQYPDLFNREFWRAKDKKAAEKAAKSVKDLKGIGSYPNTEFDFAKLHEYTVEPTNFENTNEVEEATASPWD